MRQSSARGRLPAFNTSAAIGITTISVTNANAVPNARPKPGSTLGCTQLVRAYMEKSSDRGGDGNVRERRRRHAPLRIAARGGEQDGGARRACRELGEPPGERPAAVGRGHPDQEQRRHVLVQAPLQVV